MSPAEIIEARRAYLRGLAWDGVPRLRDIVPGAAPAEGFAQWMADAARRGITPGAPVGGALVLCGEQGTRKTGMLRALFGDAYAEPHQAPTDRGAWVVCIEEGETINPAMLATWSAHRVDARDRPRPYVHAATTNAPAWARRAAGHGARVIAVYAPLDVEGITAQRDQLWAEAVQMLRAEGGPT